jgi:hypothetical protein
MMKIYMIKRLKKSFFFLEKDIIGFIDVETNHRQW